PQLYSTMLLQSHPAHGPPPFPYTTLFRSDDAQLLHLVDESAGARIAEAQAALQERSGSLSRLHDALDRLVQHRVAARFIVRAVQDRKSTRLNSSHVSISYAVFCLKKKNSY